jgi:large subunit ribosomal protein L4
MEGQILREANLDTYVFDAPINTAVLHQVVTAQFVNRRQGTASTKNRQKGTGRARQGSTRAPHWRGGGSVFGPRPHTYDRSIPRRVKRLAIRAALSDKVANGKLLLIDKLTFDAPRTKDMLATLETLPIERNVLLLMPERDENVILSARNIHRIKMGHVSSINVIEILKYDMLMMPLATVDRIVEMFGAEADDALVARRHPRAAARRKARREMEAAQARQARG